MFSAKSNTIESWTESAVDRTMERMHKFYEYEHQTNVQRIKCVSIAWCMCFMFWENGKFTPKEILIHMDNNWMIFSVNEKAFPTKFILFAVITLFLSVS